MSSSSSANPPQQQTPVTAEQYHQMGIGDTIRYRSAFGRPVDPKTGLPSVAGDDYVNAMRGDKNNQFNNSLPTLLNRFDMIFFLVLIGGFALLLKVQYKIDLTPIVWNFVKPSYDHGVNDYWSWDGSSNQNDPSPADLQLNDDL